MNDSSFGMPQVRGVSALLGPAVASRRAPRHATPLGAVAEPPAPFVRPGWRPVETPITSVATVEEEPDIQLAEAAPEDLPLLAAEEEAWRDRPATEPEAVGDDDLGLVRGADWGLATGDVDLGGDEPDMVLEEPLGASAGASEEVASPESERAEPKAALSQGAAVAAMHDAMTAVGAAAALERVPDAESSPVEARSEALEHAAHAKPVSGDEEVPALQEVAGRLERIAQALRGGRPIELFASGSSDPLEVLIAGYALGYSEAYRRANEERRSGQ